MSTGACLPAISAQSGLLQPAGKGAAVVSTACLTLHAGDGNGSWLAHQGYRLAPDCLQASRLQYRLAPYTQEDWVSILETGAESCSVHFCISPELQLFEKAKVLTVSHFSKVADRNHLNYGCQAVQVQVHAAGCC